MKRQFALLIVDNDLPVSKKLKALLMQRLPRSRIDVTTNGANAQRPVAAGDYDLVLLDLQLPDMSTFDLFDNLRALKYQGPIAFLSRESDAGVAAQAFRKGAVDYLVKTNHLLESVFNVVVRGLEMEWLR